MAEGTGRRGRRPPDGEASMKKRVNLILLAGMVLPLLSYLPLGWEGGMALAAIPVLGYVYPSLPFAFLQLLLCYNLRGRFSRLARLLPLVAVGPFHLLGWHWITTSSGVGAMLGVILITFTTLPALGIGLGWAAWTVLRWTGRLE